MHKIKNLYWVLIAVSILVVVVIFSYPTGRVVQETGYVDISVEEAKTIIENDPNLVIIDVSPLYDEGHLPGAINYYVGDGSLDRAIPNLNPDTRYLVYCHFDSASRTGAQKLVDAGFTRVYRLESHFSGWVEAGYPIEM